MRFIAPRVDASGNPIPRRKGSDGAQQPDNTWFCARHKRTFHVSGDAKEECPWCSPHPAHPTPPQMIREHAEACDLDVDEENERIATTWAEARAELLAKNSPQNNPTKVA